MRENAVMGSELKSKLRSVFFFISSFQMLVPTQCHVHAITCMPPPICIAITVVGGKIAVLDTTPNWVAELAKL